MFHLIRLILIPSQDGVGGVGRGLRAQKGLRV